MVRNKCFLIKQVLILILVTLLGVGIRLYLAFYYYGNYDQNSYEIVVDIMRRGGNVYSETSRYNYSPVWSYCLFYLNELAIFTQFKFHFVLRSFLTLIDVFNALLIGLISVKIGTKLNKTVGYAVYLLNPVAILIVGLHGQFETLAMLPLLLATYLYVRRSKPLPQMWIWLLGTLALLIKHNTIFGVLMLFVYTARNWRRAIIMFLLSLILFLASFAAYFPQGRSGILQNVFMYSAKSGYGLQVLFPLWANLLIFVSFMLLLPFAAKNYFSFIQSKGMELSFVALIVSIIGIAEQYFILPIFFGSIYTSSWYWLYTLSATFFLIGSPNNINIPLFPSFWNLVWISSVGWLLSYFLTWKPPLDQPEFKNKFTSFIGSIYRSFDA